MVNYMYTYIGGIPAIQINWSEDPEDSNGEMGWYTESFTSTALHAQISLGS